MNEDTQEIGRFIAEICFLRSKVAFRKSVENNGKPWIVTKSIADYQDGYFTEMKGIHVDWVKRETQELEWQLKRLEEKLTKMREYL